MFTIILWIVKAWILFHVAIFCLHVITNACILVIKGVEYLFTKGETNEK